jgi:hypothetical protein
VKARHALHEQLGEIGELADGGEESGHIEGKGDEIDIAHFPLHDKHAAEDDDHHRKQTHNNSRRKK